MKRIVFIGEWRIKSGSATNKLSFHFELLFENGQFNWNEVVWAVCRPRHNPIQWNWLDWRRVSEWTEWINLFMNEVSERKGRRPSAVSQSIINSQSNQRIIDLMELIDLLMSGASNSFISSSLIQLLGQRCSLLSIKERRAINNPFFLSFKQFHWLKGRVGWLN